MRRSTLTPERRHFLPEPPPQRHPSRRRLPLFSSGITHEDVTDAVTIYERSRTAGNPLASGRYRR